MPGDHVGRPPRDRQIRSVGVEVNKLGKQCGIERFGHDADDASTWIVLDFIDLVVHLFEPGTRAHYDLEMMWGDAPKINWRERSSGKVWL